MESVQFPEESANKNIKFVKQKFMRGSYKATLKMRGKMKVVREEQHSKRFK
jgi:hypothetical protein